MICTATPVPVPVIVEPLVTYNLLESRLRGPLRSRFVRGTPLGSMKWVYMFFFSSYTLLANKYRLMCEA